MWLHGQAVKTPPFHGGNRGSIPRGVTILILSGGNSGEDTPVPISNTEVKLSSADDTWWETARESRTLPVKLICGSGSGVEHRLAKARVASSNLVFRSKRKVGNIPAFFLCIITLICLLF